MKEGNKLKSNMLINAVKSLMSVVFPLVSFPYISRTLGVEGMGQYSFSCSVINYVSLIAGLGISTYAIREGSRIRNNKFLIKTFVDEIFTISIISTIFSYLCLTFSLHAITKLNEYRLLIVILSLQVLFKTIGIEWIYSIYEDFLFVTIRSFFLQVMSLALIFLCVKSTKDIYIYAIITVAVEAVSSIVNIVCCRKYYIIGISRSFGIIKHVKPVMILFAMAIAITIYTSSDITMLGIMCDDYTVGVYSVSTKIYSIVRMVLSSVIVVSIPRISGLLGNDSREMVYDATSDVYATLITIVLPCVVGIIALRKEIVILISSERYIDASASLAILGIALFFCLGAWFWGQCILVPLKMEGEVFKITIASALINIVLNYLLIPFWQEKSAAITTVISEGIAFVLCWHKGKKKVIIKGTKSILLKTLGGCIVVFALICFTRNIVIGDIKRIILSVSVSVVVYVAFELLLKNEAILCFVKKNKD